MRRNLTQYNKKSKDTDIYMSFEDNISNKLEPAMIRINNANSKIIVHMVR